LAAVSLPAAIAVMQMAMTHVAPLEADQSDYVLHSPYFEVSLPPDCPGSTGCF